jgi:hypothetical protein
MRGRKRNLNVVRDESGKSREHELAQRLDYESRLAQRRMRLAAEGINPDTAHLPLSGFTLGKLYLRHKADEKDPGAISHEQYLAGDRFTRIWHRYSRIVLDTKRQSSPGFVMVSGGGGATPEADPRDIAEAREDFRCVYDALAKRSKVDGFRVMEVVYGVCIDNWRADQLSVDDYGILREALNMVGRELRTLDKRRRSV